MFEDLYDYLQEDIDYQSLLKPIIPFLEKNKTILDAGCGSGHILYHLSKRGFNVTGIDINEGMLSLAQEKLNRLNLNDRLYLHDLRNPLYFKFDRIICLLDVIHYFKGAKGVIRNLFNSLNDKGILILDIYKSAVNETEYEEYEDFNINWEVKTIKNRIIHNIDISGIDINETYTIKQYFYPKEYYVNLLKEIGFKVETKLSFDDRKLLLICSK